MRVGALRVPTAIVLVAFLANVPLGLDPSEPRAAAAENPFSANVRVTDGLSPLSHQVEPYLVVDPTGRLIIGWKEALTSEGPGRRVGIARSLDGGLTWSPNAPMDRANATRSQSDPWLAVDDLGRAYFARLEFGERESDVRVSRSDDGGLTWGPIANADDRLGFADKESIASDGAGTLYVAYDDVADNTTDIRIARSTDAGRTWSATVPAPDRTGDLLAPVIAARPGGPVVVAWWNISDGDIRGDVSRDRGATWGADVRINAVPGSARYDTMAPVAQLSLPSIATDRNGTVFVAWPDRGAGDLDILVARSADGGATWSAPVRVNDDASRRDQWMPALAADRDGNLHVAWMDNRTGNLNVFYARSTDGGRTWSPNVRVTTAETPSTYTRPGDYLGLAVDGDGVAYVVWTDGRGSDLDIYFARYPAPAVASPPMVLGFVVTSLIAVAAAATVVTYVLLRHARKRGPPSGPGEAPHR